MLPAAATCLIRHDLTMVRLFVAIWPSDDVCERLRALPRKDRPGVRWVLPDNWHVTLRFLGDADPAEVAARLDDVVFETAQLRFGPGLDVLGERVIVVPVDGVGDLARAVLDATRGLGTHDPPKRFNGHLTVARLKGRARIRDLVGLPVEATQQATEVALVTSRLHRDGARYETLATWPTGPERTG